MSEGDPPEHDIDAWLSFAGTDLETEKEPFRWSAVRLLAVALAAATLIGLIVLRPTGEAKQTSADRLNVLGVPSQFVSAPIMEVTEAGCSFSPDIACTRVVFQISSGPDEGSIYSQEFVEDEIAPEFDVGRTAVLSYRPPEAEVLSVTDAPCSFAPELECVNVKVRIGDPPGRIADTEIPADGPEDLLIPGDEVLVSLFEGEGGEPELVGVFLPTIDAQYRFADFQRRPVLAWVAILFAVAVVVLGRWRGLAALVGLVASLGVILLFVLPAILDGRSPVWVAAVGATAIAFVALYMAHGFHDKTTVALLGTVGALLLTAILSSIVVAAAQFTGFATEESSLLTLFPGIDVRGLVLAGIVLGAAGALDDVTVTQASAVWELRIARPDIDRRDLFRRGLRIGRDHIASTVNTLLLAYAGASLPLLILFVLSSQSLGTIANSETVAVEVVRTLVGSIGLVAAVPLTTWLATVVSSPVPTTSPP